MDLWILHHVRIEPPTICIHCTFSDTVHSEWITQPRHQKSMVQVYGPRSQSFENIPFELYIWFSVLICIALCAY